MSKITKLWNYSPETIATTSLAVLQKKALRFTMIMQILQAITLGVASFPLTLTSSFSSSIFVWNRTRLVPLLSQESPNTRQLVLKDEPLTESG